jgi:hypothetical protein
MQLRCSYCQTMFAISRDETLAAIEHMAEHSLKYFDAHCPNCRRANRVERFKLESSFPGWQAAIKTMTKEADKADAEQAASAVSSTKAASSPKEKKPAEKKAASKPDKTSSPKKKPAAVSSSPKAKKK